MRLCWTWFGLVLLFILGAGSVMAQDVPVDANIDAISPDGTRLAVSWWSSEESKSFRAVLDLSDGSRRLIPDNMTPFMSWSPDNTRIAAVLITDDPYDLAMIDPDTLEVQSVVENVPFINEMSWSPDGRWLLLGARRGEYYLWDSVSGDLTQILDLSYIPEGDLIYLWTYWSPDSRFVAFAATIVDQATLLVYDIDRRKISENFLASYDVALTPFVAPIADWSPDSQQLVVSIARDHSLYLVDVGKTAYTHFVETNNAISGLKWSADGTAIYYLAASGSSSPPGLYRADVPYGTVTLMVEGEMTPVFAPDRRHFVAFVEEPDIFTVGIGDLVSGEVFPLDIDPTMITSSYWSADSRSFLLTVCRDTEADMYRIDIEERVAVNLTDDVDASASPGCIGRG